MRLARERRQVAGLRGRAERDRYETRGADAEERPDEIADLGDDERNANYEVAIERCDALAMAPKDRCLADAKARYRK